MNWDAVWEVKSKRGDYGWSAEFAIPFKTLRYKKSDDQSWGINFERVIGRKGDDVLDISSTDFVFQSIELQFHNTYIFG